LVSRSASRPHDRCRVLRTVQGLHRDQRRLEPATVLLLAMGAL